MNKKPKEIMEELNKKFNANFNAWSAIDDPQLEKSFTGLKCIAAAGDILRTQKKYRHHEICCQIYDEIFSDGVSAIYLASNAMDKPARIILRRVLELGIAAIYLWDMPHTVFSWQEHDHDLSFSDMLKHVNSPGYISYLNQENGSEITSEIVPSAKAQRIYGAISDVVHGKITTFETSMPNRFQFLEVDWKEFIALAQDVIEILVNAYTARFDISTQLYASVPLAKKEFA